MLPGEIRNQIYRFAFRPRELDIRPPLTKTPVAGHIYAERDCYESQTLIRITPFLPALLRVNRQIRSEAYTLVFEKVILRLVEQSIARPFMGSNSFWTHTRHLQVRLFMEKETDPHFVELLIKCPKLETVLIELDYHSGWQGICYAYNFAKLAFRLTQLLEALSKLEKSRYWLGAGTTTTF